MTLKHLLYCLAAVCAVHTSMAQQDTIVQTAPVSSSPFRLHTAFDISATAVAGAWTMYGFSRVSNKSHSTEEGILALNKSNINWFDRWAVHKVSNSADQASYIPFYVSMPMPLFFLLDKKMRKDFVRLTLLYAEAMTFTGVLYSSATMYADRYRPFVYSPESPMDKRLPGSAKNSFFAGHVALVATSTFFMASAWAGYHPNSQLKWLFYGGAGAMTATTAYLRYKAGMHFPSDILIGTAVGTLSGVLVPHFHKNNLHKKTHFSLSPYASPGAQGLTLRYKV